MTLLGWEGFEVDSANTDLHRKYDESTGFSGATGRLHGTSGASTGHIRTLSFGSQSEVIVGLGLNLWNPGTQESFPQIRFMKGLVEQCRFEFEQPTTGTFRWRLMRGSTELGVSSTYTSLNWHYFEFRALVATVGGEMEVRHNESIDVTVTGANTAEAGSNDADILDFQLANSRVRVDDIYWLTTDTTTNAGDNTYLGDSVIEGIEAEADGSTTAWTPSSGTAHWSLLSGAVNDNDYVESTTVGALDLLSLRDVSFLQGIIHGISLSTSSRLDSLGSRTLKHKARSGASNFDGSQFVVSQTGVRSFVGLFLQDPNTTARWTITNINNAEFGFEIVA